MCFWDFEENVNCSYFSLDNLVLDVSRRVDCLKKHRRALRLVHRL